jgi:hypothetical protein
MGGSAQALRSLSQTVYPQRSKASSRPAAVDRTAATGRVGAML